MAAVAASSAIAAPAGLSSKVQIGNGATRASRCLSLPQVPARSARTATVVCAQQQQQQEATSTASRRSMIGLLAGAVAATALVSESQAEPLKLKVSPPPLPIGGLPGTENADQARDTDLRLKERFYLQALSPEEAINRAKESAAQIVAVKGLIEKKAWPYVQNDLRSKAGYLRFDLNTVINAKPKAQKKELTALANKLYDSIAALDYAARSKSPSDASKNYDTTVKLLQDVLSKAA